MNELCDEKRFTKIVAGPLKEVRNGIHDGLFTAHPGEHNWELAHRILIPAFGPLPIRGMYDGMHDIATQLVMKWARRGVDYVIPVTDDFTRLTLDTLSLCAMDFRFNSFYQNEMHPFVGAMASFLKESGARSSRLAVVKPFFRQQESDYNANINLMRKTGLEVIEARRKHPNDNKDLLNAMLNGRDPKTGEGMNDDSIIDNMITFLIAGHETTSGMLSFLFYYLLKSPSALARAQEEVDTVIGTKPIQVEHLTKLPYINAMLRETLRLQPTASAFSLQIRPDAAEESTVIGGKYTVKKGEPLVAILPKIQTDPSVFGEDALAWKPDRMLDEPFGKLPPNSWKPFGNGMRGCIGRPFAWQEAQLVVAILLQNFQFFPEDPSYQLRFKQTLTIKPKDFQMRAQLRQGRELLNLERSLYAGPANVVKKTPSTNGVDVATKSDKGHPIEIYYGSNSGTCQALASRLATDASARGFKVRINDSLDVAAKSLPKDAPIIILTASYEGQPPDNAAHFVHWLEGLTEKEAEGVKYAVFGCGHHDWQATFQRIPVLVDNLLAERGAQRIAERGTADAAQGDMFNEFDTWEEKVFWPAMVKQYGGSADTEVSVEGMTVQISNQDRSSHLRQDVQEAQVVDTNLLTSPSEPAKRHIEIKLPAGMSYRTGDYLAILPLNPAQSVQRALRYFSLASDAVLTITSKEESNLPTGVPISAIDLFTSYVELAQPATRRVSLRLAIPYFPDTNLMGLQNIHALSKATEDQPTKDSLLAILDANMTETHRLSVLELLERNKSISVTLGAFIAMLPPMRIRQYSISSSPLWKPDTVTLTYAVLDAEAFSGAGRFKGVGSNFLARLEKGDKLHVAVKASGQSFHLPSDVENVPVIMIAAGTGFAPFRGFIQERAMQIEAGRKLAPALLFVGCRHPEQDELYRKELSRWQDLGAVDVRRAYSRCKSQSDDCGYVQDRLWKDRKDVVKVFDQGAKVYICGGRSVGEGINKAILNIVLDRAVQNGKEIDEEKAQAWFDRVRSDRFATEVFG